MDGAALSDLYVGHSNCVIAGFLRNENDVVARPC
jgi:hypothetical protein